MEINTARDTILDYFYKSILKGDEENIIVYFKEALEVDKLTTLKILFYSRDVRGGLGNREPFRKVLKYLGENEPELVRVNLALIPYYGRWDDLYALFDTPVEDDVILLFKRQLRIDIESETPSLLAKWMKSSNTSSAESRYLANRTISKIGLSHRAYRKTLSYLRKKLNLVERSLTEKRYEDICYEELPIGALKKYKKAFMKHDMERYKEYFEVERGSENLDFNNKEELLLKLLGILNLERYSFINVI